MFPRLIGNPNKLGIHKTHENITKQGWLKLVQN
jgi:hypothetical protein